MTDAQRPPYDVATALLRDWRRPLLVSHAKPDGDAIGSLVALRRVLRGCGKDPVGLVFDPIPDRYRFLVDIDPLQRLGQDVSLPDLDTRGLDGVIIVDTCTYNQLEPIADWLRSSTLPKLAIDHHVTRDDVADTYLVDESAAATCVILDEFFGWLTTSGYSIDSTTARALFVGIATDTGWFRHSNTDGRALAVAAELMLAGVQPSTVYDSLFQQESAARFQLRAAVAGRLELLAEGRLAVQTLPASILADTGSTLADTEDLVNEPLRIGTTVLSVMLVEQGAETTRVGFRSRAPANEHAPDIDVAAVAKTFGGGGHRRAAGARIQAPLEQAKRQVIESLTTALGGM